MFTQGLSKLYKLKIQFKNVNYKAFNCFFSTWNTTLELIVFRVYVQLGFHWSLLLKSNKHRLKSN